MRQKITNWMLVAVFLCVGALGTVSTTEAQSITFTTSLESGQSVSLLIEANGDIEATGIAGPLEPGVFTSYTLLDQTVTITGDITFFNCSFTPLNSLDVSQCSNLTDLYCFDTQLSSLSIKGAYNLTKLWCENNSLTTLDLSECPKLKEIKCYENALTSLDLSHCVAIETLLCNDNNLSELDLSAAPNLYELNCSTNTIADLNLSMNSKTDQVYCNSNELTSLNVAACTQLTRLSCYDNQLSSLDVSQNKKLIELNCGGNRLTALDCSFNSELEKLFCYQNQLTALDLATCPELRWLWIESNNLNCNEMDDLVSSLPYRGINDGATLVVVTEAEMSADPVKGNTMVQHTAETAKAKGWTTYYSEAAGSFRLTLYKGYEGSCEDYVSGSAVSMTTAKEVGQKITIALSAEGDVTVTGLMGTVVADGLYRTYELTARTVTLSGDITYLDCHANELTALDVSQDLVLTQLYCSENALTALDVTKNPDLEKLEFFKNKVQYIDLSKSGKLNMLSAAENELTTLDLSACTALTDLKIWKNKLVTLDVSHCPLLNSLACHGNNLKTLQLTNMHQMTYLNCDENQLTSLDLSDCERLDQLKCAGNKLTSLNITHCAALTHVWANNNQLTSLDVSQCDELVRIECAQNKLTAIDLTHAPKLAYLVCYANELTSLDVSKCPELKKISCEENRISCADMESVANGLPFKSGLKGSLYVVTNKEKNACSGEGNIATKHVVGMIKAKNWKVYSVIEAGSSESAAYEGRDGDCTDNVLTYAVTVQETINGSIELVGAENLAAVPCGTEIRVEVTPDAGYQLARMAANEEDITESKRFVVNSNVLVKAFFATPVEEVSVQQNHLYPNPANDLATLIGAAPESEVCLYTMEGILLQRVVTNLEGRAQLNVALLPEGHYPLQFTDSEGRKCIALLTVKH